MENLIQSIQNICQYLNANMNDVKIFERSYNKVGKCHLIMLKLCGNKLIIISGAGLIYEELEGEIIFSCKLCPLSHANRLVLNKYLDYTLPRALGSNTATFGVGDRLGITSPAHIKALENCGARIVLAQQSKRELSLTGRTYDEVLDAASFAVIQEGYRDGFGADGDHLKTEKEIEDALQCGLSMITLDCSEKINNSIEELDEAELYSCYAQLPQAVREYYEKGYLNQNFAVDDIIINYPELTLIKNVLIYADVIEFIEVIYTTQIASGSRRIDFEISLDETTRSTSVPGHFLVASEIEKRQVTISSLAPRFVGEFQKGIDYIGETADFEQDIRNHARLADHFGYKLSIHSGSDKFSIFRSIGEQTKGRFHIKTSGTSWLEAVRVIAEVKPDLYRRMHKFALAHFEEARAYYHVSTNLDAIADIDSLTDRELPDYLNENNSRQLMHITYGLILNSSDSENSSMRDEIFRTLEKYSAQYEQGIVRHIKKHVSLLLE